jgi:fatty-acyl-CoA synthase
MMDVALGAWMLFDHAPRYFGDTEVVSQVQPGVLHRQTYADFGRRAQQLMHGLDRLGIEPGARVATLAWNGHRHLELYFAIPCTGRVLHTLNTRLAPDELAYIIEHADDRAIFVDADLLPVLEQLGGKLDRVEHVVVMADAVPAGSSLQGLLAYEDLIADEPTTYARPDIPETAPLGLCYTSGTTGRPKGVVYTHRSTFLHALAATSGAAFGLGPQDRVLPVVPMFHANAWGLPFAATAVGAKQVFAGRHVDPTSVVDLLVGEHITVTAGVPTVWLGVGDELAARGVELPDLRHVVCGGSQPPRALIERFRRDFGISIVQAWGMTETSPLASLAMPKEKMADWADDDVTDAVRTQAGIPVPGVEVAIRGDDGVDVAWDGVTMGQLLVRGPWVADAYVGGDGAEQFTADGWFRTGDVAIGSPEGYFVIADRTKDLIKSGGEWISSVDLEAAIMAVPGVAEAAVIAIPDARWMERPLACVALRPDADPGCVALDALCTHLEGSGFARWQFPDRVEIVDALPRTSVGKFDKKALRARFPS